MMSRSQSQSQSQSRLKICPSDHRIYSDRFGSTYYKSKSGRRVYCQQAQSSDPDLPSQKLLALSRIDQRDQRNQRDHWKASATLPELGLRHTLEPIPRPMILSEVVSSLPTDIRGTIGQYWQGQELATLPSSYSFSVRYLPNKNRLSLYIGLIEFPSELSDNLTDLIKYLYLTRRLNHNKMLERYQNLLTPLQKSFSGAYMQWNSAQVASRFGECNPQIDEEYYIMSNLILPDLNRVKPYPITYLLQDYDLIYRGRKLPNLMELPLFTREGLVICITLINLSGINKHFRGMQALDYALHYWDTYTVEDPRGVTVGELVVGLYKIKSHKFDNYYEAVHRIQVQSETLKTGVKLTIALEFKHRS